MRSLFDIIEAAKSNESVTERELRLALCALSGLTHFDVRALMDLAQSEKEGKTPKLLTATYQWEESFRRHKLAMAKSPEDWLGLNNLPENPEYQKGRKLALKLFDKILKKSEGTG